MDACTFLCYLCVCWLAFLGIASSGVAKWEASNAPWGTAFKCLAVTVMMMEECVDVLYRSTQAVCVWGELDELDERVARS